MPEVKVGSQNFALGWVTVSPPHLIEEGATPNVANVDFSRSFGRITKRRGYSVLISERTGSNDVTGLHEAIYSDGTTRLFAASNDDVYELTAPGTWTSRFNDAGMNGVETNFVTYGDLCIFFNDNITTQKIDSNDAASSALGGTPPANVKYGEVHKGRVWLANSSAGISRLHHSALDDPEDWTTAGNAGFYDIGLNDGDEITGIKSLGSFLLIFKHRSVWGLFGNAPSNFTYRKLSATVGCPSNRTIQAAENFCLFLGHDGVYAAKASGVTFISYNIKPTLEALSNTQRTSACSALYHNQYWLCLDTDSDGTNDEVYYLDYVLGIWGRYTNKKEKVFLRRRDGTLISGGDDSDVIRKHDDTENDNGSAITMTYDTKDYDFGDWTAVKLLKWLKVVAKPISSKTITLSFLQDGVANATTFSFSLTRTGSYDKVYFNVLTATHTRGPASYSPYIRFRLSNAETDAACEVYAFEAACELDPGR